MSAAVCEPSTLRVHRDEFTQGRTGFPIGMVNILDELTKQTIAFMGSGTR
jgi:hypothetical protein